MVISETKLWTSNETTATLLFQNKGEIGYWDLILPLSYLIYREIEVEVDLRESLVVEEFDWRIYFEEIKVFPAQTRWTPQLKGNNS
jgi:hypothetical protein